MWANNRVLCTMISISISMFFFCCIHLIVCFNLSAIRMYRCTRQRYAAMHCDAYQSELTRVICGAYLCCTLLSAHSRCLSASILWTEIGNLSVTMEGVSLSFSTDCVRSGVCVCAVRVAQSAAQLVRGRPVANVGQSKLVVTELSTLDLATKAGNSPWWLRGYTHLISIVFGFAVDAFI